MQNPALTNLRPRIEAALWKVAGAILVVAAILVIFTWIRAASRSDDWAVRRMEQAKRNGWTLIMKYRTFDIARPWTWFKPYIYTLTFVRPDSVREASKIKRAEMMWYLRQENGKIEVFHDFQVFDCARKKFATLWTQELKYWKTDPFGRDIEDNYWLEMTKEMRSFFCK